MPTYYYTKTGVQARKEIQHLIGVVSGMIGTVKACKKMVEKESESSNANMGEVNGTILQMMASLTAEKTVFANLSALYAPYYYSFTFSDNDATSLGVGNSGSLGVLSRNIAWPPVFSQLDLIRLTGSAVAANDGDYQISTVGTASMLLSTTINTPTSPDVSLLAKRLAVYR